MKKYLFICVFCLLLIQVHAFTLFDAYWTLHPAISLYFDKSLSGKAVDYEGNIKCEYTFVHKTRNKLEFMEQITPSVRLSSIDLISEDEFDCIMLLVGKEFRNNTWENFAWGFMKDNTPIIWNLPRIMEWYNQYKDCTSYLTEGTKEYTIDNLSEIRIDSPWVEGVPGNGEGEGFTIVGNDKYLLLVNGFISVNKPYLYEQNSRVKELEITGSKSGKTKVVKFLDTPNPQTADISFLEEGDDTIVRIKSVYPGTKYQDTCISHCKLYRNKVIPYLGEEDGDR